MVTRLDRRNQILFALVLIVILFATRVSHLKGPIDEPHSWRQCDTAYYALTFHEEGIDPFHPKVCWMGGHEVLILEFAFPEMLMALVYDAFGEDVLYSRILTLLAFALSALFLWLIVRRLFDDAVASVSAAVYCVLPMSLFYSRAVHIDFYAICLGHAMFYYLMRGYEERSVGRLVVGAAAGSLGFLVKGPYTFYFALPLAVFVLFRFNRRWASYLVAAFLVCVLIFIAWRWHVNRVNGMAPDWYFIPGYAKFVDMWGRYFGPLAWRWDIESWRRLLPRLQNDVASMTGFCLFLLSLVGSFFAARHFGRRAVCVAWAWLAGVLGYLLLFFSLNVWHNYYQMPLLPIVSIFIGLGLVALARLLSRWISVWGWIPALGLFVMLAVNSISYAESSYYGRDETRIEAGAIIRSNTPEESIVIAAPDVRATNFEDPRLLYRARRRGWSISKSSLSAEIVRRLAGYGATHLALVVGRDERVDELYGMRGQSHLLRSGPWKVALFDLSQLPGDVF